MAVSRHVEQVKFIVRVDKGDNKAKNLTYSRIKSDAGDDAFFAAAKAIGSLQAHAVEAIYRHDIVALTEQA